MRLTYSGPVYFAPAWRGIYRNDLERIQTWDEAVASSAAVSTTWRELGYDLLDLPLASVAERADFVEETLSRA